MPSILLQPNKEILSLFFFCISKANINIYFSVKIDIFKKSGLNSYYFIDISHFLENL